MIAAGRNFALVFALAFALSFGAAAADTSELSITADGTFVGKNLTVKQKSGTNLFTRANWGQAFVRITVLTASSTDIAKKHGEKMTVGEIKEDDVLDVDGKLSLAGDSIIVSASRIQDISEQRQSDTISGIVQGVDRGELSFTLPSRFFGTTKVILSASTPIQKGARSIQLDEISPGDKVLSASGIYDYATDSLTASSVEIYQDKSIFKEKNFQGTLKYKSGNALPITLTVTVDGTDYTVYLPEKSPVMKKNRSATSLLRFAEGDTVRFWGKIRETNFSEIDAELIRNLDF